MPANPLAPAERHGRLRWRRRGVACCAAAVFSSAQLAGCVTQRLWEATDPNATVVLARSEITKEELEAEGRPYRQRGDGDFRVAKTSSERARDVAMRFFFLPLTVAADLSIAWLIVVPILLLDEWADDSGGHTHTQAQRQQAEFEQNRQ